MHGLNLMQYVVNKYNSKIPLTHTLTICNLKQSYHIVLKIDRKIVSQVTNGELQGNTYMLNTYNELIIKVKFIAGVIYGQYYFSNDNTDIKANYHKGLLNGKVKIYQYDEYYEMSFVKGKINGYFKYMKNNKLIQRIKIKSNRLFHYNYYVKDIITNDIKINYGHLNSFIYHIRNRLQFIN